MQCIIAVNFEAFVCHPTLQIFS